MTHFQSAGPMAVSELVQRFRLREIEADRLYLPDGCEVHQFILSYSQFRA